MSQCKNKVFRKINWGGIFLIVIFLIGFFLRLKGLLMNPSFWHDECALAWNIKFKNYSDLFGVLNFEQMAPPFFMILTKLLTKILGLSEFTMRLLPFFVGCFSMVAFYFLAKRVLVKNFSVILAVFLFAVNLNLINYSFEFKPYGLDVFFTIICLLFFTKLKVENSSASKIVIAGLIIAFLPWFSLVSVFIIAGGFINLFVSNIKTDIKKKFILICPFFISILIYLKIYLLDNYSSGSGLLQIWQNYFVTLNLKHFLWLITTNLQYFFEPTKYILFVLILFIWGVFILVKDNRKFLKISLISLFLLIFTSLLHIYPFLARLILFLLPIFILTITKPLDLISYKNKGKSIIIICLFAVSFYPQVTSAIQIFGAKNIDRQENPHEMMKYIQKHARPDDIIFVNKDSDAEFAYYSSVFNVKNKFIQEEIKNPDQKEYMEYLNSLKRGKYWFFLPIDYISTPVSEWVENWAKEEKVLYFYKNNSNDKKNNSILIYVLVK